MTEDRKGVVAGAVSGFLVAGGLWEMMFFFILPFARSRSDFFGGRLVGSPFQDIAVQFLIFLLIAGIIGAICGSILGTTFSTFREHIPGKNIFSKSLIFSLLWLIPLSLILLIFSDYFAVITAIIPLIGFAIMFSIVWTGLDLVKKRA